MKALFSRLLMALLAAVLVRLSAPPTSWPFLGLVALVPLCVALRERPALERAALGFAFGTALNAALAWSWAASAIVAFTDVSALRAHLLVTLLCVWQGTVYALAGAASTGLERLRFPAPIAFALAVAAAEWLIPLWLPSTLALAVEPSSLLGQLAVLGGTPLVASAVALASGTVVDIASSARARRAPAWGAPLALAGALLAGLLHRQGGREPVTDTLRIRLVQANAVRAPLRAHAEAGRDAHEPVDLVVWAEGATGLTYSEDALDALARKVVAESRAPTLLGSDVRAGRNASAPLFNSALLVDSGGVRGRHDKEDLFALGETATFEPLGAVGTWLLPTRTRDVYAPGRDHHAPLRFVGPHGAAALQTLLCLEDATPLAAAATDEPSLLVGLSNDRWFGSTAEPWLHEALARFRAVEAGVPLVRVANTGVSGAYDSRGRVLARSDVGRRWTATVSVAPEPLATPFLTCGRQLFQTLSALLLFVSAFPLVARRLAERRSLPLRLDLRLRGL